MPARATSPTGPARKVLSGRIAEIEAKLEELHAAETDLTRRIGAAVAIGVAVDQLHAKRREVREALEDGHAAARHLRGIVRRAQGPRAALTPSPTQESDPC